MLSDLARAVRTLRAARGFTAVAVLILGFALTLTITVLSVANAYLVEALPYPAPDRLFSVRYAAPGQQAPEDLEALEWSSLADVVEHPIAWDLDVFYLLGGAYPESAPGAWVTPGFVDGYGVRPALGRGFEASDFEAGRPAVVLISHRLWQTRYGGDPGVLGRAIRAYVSDRPDEPETLTIVGVLPETFWHLNTYTEILAPLRAPTFPYMVRLRDDVSSADAAARITALVRGGGREVAEGWQATLVSTHDAYVAAVRPMLTAVTMAAGLVLLTACANVAVLLLVRASRRTRELAVRLAIGATRRQIARLLAFEALIVGAAATAVALLASLAVLDWAAPLVEELSGRRVPGGFSRIALDGTVLAWAVAAGLGTTALVALVPVVTTWRADLTDALASGGRTTTGDRGARRTRAVLVAVEVAVALALVAGSALMVETARRMLRVDFGIDAQGVATASLGLRERSYPDPVARAAFFERLLARFEAEGWSPVALGDTWPMQEPGPDAAATAGDARADVAITGITDRYFDLLAMTVRDGRPFTPADRQGSEPVAIVSESLAARLWPGQPAVGQLLRTTDEGGDETGRMVVGVVSDVRQTHTDVDLLDVYVPLLQNAGRFVYVYTRADVRGELRNLMASVDPEVAVGAPEPLAAFIDDERARPRFLATSLSAFAGLSALVALIGVYGVIAYAVRQREREVAMRLCLGADRRSITRLFMRQGAWVIGAGSAAGLASGAALGRVLESQLFGVRPLEPSVLAVATLALTLCGLLAVWWPAWRAGGIEPVSALKEE